MVQLTGHRTIGNKINELVTTWAALPAIWPWMLPQGDSPVPEGPWAGSAAAAAAAMRPTVVLQLRPAPVVEQPSSTSPTTKAAATTTAGTTTSATLPTEGAAGDVQDTGEGRTFTDASTATTTPTKATPMPDSGSPVDVVR
jgi:hypothetical protein